MKKIDDSDRLREDKRTACLDNGWLEVCPLNCLKRKFWCKPATSILLPLVDYRPSSPSFVSVYKYLQVKTWDGPSCLRIWGEWHEDESQLVIRTTPQTVWRESSTPSLTLFAADHGEPQRTAKGRQAQARGTGGCRLLWTSRDRRNGHLGAVSPILTRSGPEGEVLWGSLCVLVILTLLDALDYACQGLS